MVIVYVGGPVDGMEESGWTGPLPEILYVPRKPVRRFVKEADHRLPPGPTPCHHYRFRDSIGGIASYVFVRE